MVYLILVTGAVATFLLFWSLSGLLLRIFMSWKQVYYRKLNSFTLRQFSSKINTTVLSMTMICLMLFVTICVFSSAMSIRNSINETARQSMPADVEFTEAYRVNNEDDSMTVTINQQGMAQELGVKDFYRSEGVDIDSLFSDYVEYTTYVIPSWSLRDSLGEAIDDIEAQFPMIYYDQSETLIRQSDYNALARIYGNPEVDLAKDEYAVLANYENMVTMRNRGLATKPTIKVFGQTLKPKYDKCLIGKYEFTATSNDNSGLIIIPDEFKITGENYYITRAIAKYKPGQDSREVDRILEDTWNRGLDGEKAKEVKFWVETRQSVIDDGIGLGAMVTFIGLYLGMIFLISSAAVLALKELSESSDNRQKFTMLRKIGASEKMLNRALFWQIAIFFGFPLLIAIIHSVFGIIFCGFILNTFGNMNLIQPIFLTALLIVVIYGGYFLITYFCSKNIIREHRV